MVLIGPRPKQPSVFAQLSKEIPCCRMRALVKLGLTEIAQINLGYAENLISHCERARFDLADIRSHYFVRVSHMLWETVKIVFGRSNPKLWQSTRDAYFLTGPARKVLANLSK